MHCILRYLLPNYGALLYMLHCLFWSSPQSSYSPLCQWPHQKTRSSGSPCGWRRTHLLTYSFMASCVICKIVQMKVSTNTRSSGSPREWHRTHLPANVQFPSVLCVICKIAQMKISTLSHTHTHTHTHTRLTLLANVIRTLHISAQPYGQFHTNLWLHSHKWWRMYRPAINKSINKTCLLIDR
jgi:hypothetical protein